MHFHTVTVPRFLEPALWQMTSMHSLGQGYVLWCTVWNSVPCKVRSSSTLTSSKSHLFKLSYWLCVGVHMPAGRSLFWLFWVFVLLCSSLENSKKRTKIMVYKHVCHFLSVDVKHHVYLLLAHWQFTKCQSTISTTKKSVYTISPTKCTLKLQITSA